MCNKHYQRFRKYGHFDLVKKVLSLEERFSQYVHKIDGGCWIWTGTRNELGYGKITVDHIPRLAHRIGYELVFGLIPDGQCVLHRCDNPPCVNPEHLFLGTRLENNQDMIDKGRNSKGSTHTGAKLKEEVVLELRVRYASGRVLQKELAEEYGIHPSTVSGIILGNRWKHVEMPGEPCR